MADLSRDWVSDLEQEVRRLKRNYHYRMYQRMDGNCNGCNTDDDLNADDENIDGGPGSGNWGHLGRKGLHGGSAPGGGKQNRHISPKSGEYTSWSKRRDLVAKAHITTKEELAWVPQGSRIKIDGEGVYEKKGDDWFLRRKAMDPKNKFAAQLDADGIAGKKVKISFPKKGANANIQRELVVFKENMDDMERAPRFDSPKQAKERLDPMSKKAYEGATDQQKIAIKAFTGNKGTQINDALRGGRVLSSAMKETANEMQQLMANNPSKTPMWLNRGMSQEGLAKLLGVDESAVKSAVKNLDMKSLIGLQGKDEGFMACGGTDKTGKTDEMVQVHIFAPRGTQMVAADAFKGSSADPENPEVILNKNTTVQVARSWVEDGISHVELQVVAQDGAQFKIPKGKVPSDASLKVRDPVKRPRKKKAATGTAT